MAVPTRRVYAVPGRLIGRPLQKNEFIGYERVMDASAPCDLTIPGGFRYAIKPDGEVVPDGVDIRRALRADTGDLTEVAPAKPSADVSTSSAAADSEG